MNCPRSLLMMVIPDADKDLVIGPHHGLQPDG